MPNEESFDELIRSLTPETQQQLRSAESPKQQVEMLHRWVLAAVISRTSPEEATPEELAEYFTDLPRERRERLESLPSDQIQSELRRLYYQEKFGFPHGREHRGGPDREGPGQGWDGPPHERGEGRPPEDHRRGEGREGRPPRGEGDEFRPGGPPPVPTGQEPPQRRRGGDAVPDLPLSEQAE